MRPIRSLPSILENQSFADSRDARRGQPLDELAVGEPVFARGRVDADDPQTAEIALAVATSNERVLERRESRCAGANISAAPVRLRRVLAGTDARLCTGG